MQGHNRKILKDGLLTRGSSKRELQWRKSEIRFLRRNVSEIKSGCCSVLAVKLLLGKT
jgi:hypothetical protein